VRGGGRLWRQRSASPTPRWAGRVARGALAPDLLELGLVHERVETLEKLGIFRDSTCDHLEAGVLENRLALFAVGVEQVVTAPSVEHGSEFPAEVGDVFDTGVEAKAPVGRVAVACVAGDETAAASIGGRDFDAHVPKADVLELDLDGEAGDLGEHRR
jgi:hypothetical protein